LGSKGKAGNQPPTASSKVDSRRKGQQDDGAASEPLEPLDPLEQLESDMSERSERSERSSSRVLSVERSRILRLRDGEWGFEASGVRGYRVQGCRFVGSWKERGDA
jgi:hypothetical protein